MFSVASASTIMIATSSPAIRPATTMSKTAFSSWVWVGNATHWPSIERDPDAGDRAGERQAGDLGGRGGGVDREHVVQLVGVQRHAR